MDWLPFFQWCEDSVLGTAIRESAWAFPAIEAIHLIAFAALGGAVLIVDLRLLGLGLSRQSPAALEGSMRPWVVASLVTMVITGTLLFLSEAVKCYYSTPFWIKMSSLALALAFMFTIRRIAVTRAGQSPVARWSPAVAFVSLALWSGVAWGGRWIGVSG
jgi:hypothetical protein